MTIADDLAPLIAFAAKGGWKWLQPEGTLFAFMTGDPDDLVSREDDRYVLRKSERGVVSGPLLSTPDLEVVDRFLTLRYGPDVRRAQGLPKLLLPIDAEVVASPASGVGSAVESDGFAVEWREGDRTLRAASLSRVAAARLITYGRRPADEIRREFESVTGVPAADTAG